LYGHFIEALMLGLAKAAGHRVELTQHHVEVEGVHGHWDAVIDGVLCDVKSASKYGFEKFRSGGLVKDDAFGYIGQIQTYLEAAQDIPEVTDKDRAFFFVMEKEKGHLCVDIHPRVKFDVREITRGKVERIVNSEEMPPRAFEPEDDGYSKPAKNGKPREFVPNGNKKLPMNCTYCNMKSACYGIGNLDLYVGSGSKPKYFTHIVKPPGPTWEKKEIELVGDDAEETESSA
jgi:hypothetical protein